MIGDNRVHCKVYRREPEFFRLLEAGEIDDREDDSGRMMSMLGCAEHYKAVYRLRNLEIVDYFARHDPAALHCGRLEDPQKWHRLGAFLGVDVPAGYEAHINASTPAE